ncbi:MAG: hypothetical protein K9K66_19100 [Desulfarculaceae bacterium]|nr:hypothetical protein [Desulfarculaceae bacterium]MCF8074109.1 hypothetical protein [Desulfarculaceae bacterium]MCF8103768.1 hypothetical protein [Desulfarculaceae bacterium]MCF8116843.1 hypothetical protein [Desulfarculaceae bacterium]
MARRIDICAQDLPQVDLSLVESENLSPLTSSVSARVHGITKGGVEVILKQAFIDGFHVLMDVHNTTQKLVQITLPGEGGEAPEGLRLWGDIVRFNRLEGSSGACFLVELVWIKDKPVKEARARLLKRLARLHKGGGEKSA